MTIRTIPFKRIRIGFVMICLCWRVVTFYHGSNHHLGEYACSFFHTPPRFLPFMPFMPSFLLGKKKLLRKWKWFKSICPSWWPVHPWKLTCPLKRDYLNRKYIFQPLIFRGHVSFRGSSDKNMMLVWPGYQATRLPGYHNFEASQVVEDLPAAVGTAGCRPLSLVSRPLQAPGGWMGGKHP